MVVQGGVFIGRDDSNRAKFPINTLMKCMGYKNQTLMEFYNNKNIIADINPTNLQSHLISTRVNFN